MRSEFDTLRNHLFEVVKELDIVRFKVFAKSLDGCESNNEKVPLFTEIMEKIENCPSADVLLALLADYYSWFNFEIIERIVNCFFNPSDNISREVEEYKKKFLLYCERSIFEYPPSISNSTDGIALYIKSDINPPNLKTYLADLAIALKVYPHTLMLVSISRGCVLLVLSLPSAIGRKVFPLSSVQEKQLASLGVQKLYCDGFYFNVQVSN